MALLVFPITLIGPRILTPKAVQANYEQKVNESAILGMVQENIAAQAVVKAFSLQRRPLGWFTIRNDETRRKIASATFLSTMVERTVTISVLLLHLVVLGDRRLSRDQRPDHHRHVRDLRKRVLGNLLQHRPSDALHSGVDSGGGCRTPYAGTARRADARRRPCPGAPDLPRITNDITFDRVTFQYEGGETPVLDNLSLKLDVGKPSRSSAPAAPARARCSI